MWSNFHTHSKYCDGQGELADHLQAAREKNLGTLGFSSHAPVPFDCKWCMKEEKFATYLSDIKALASNEREIEIYSGLEIDFIPGIVSPAQFRNRLNYTIGSIHFIDSFEGKPWEIDGAHEVFKEGLRKIFKGNIQSAVTRYYELTRQMVAESQPDILGHLDKIKIQNRPDTPIEEGDSWYKQEILKTLSVIKTSDVIVEVNTRGIYQKKTSFTYPSPWILEKMFESKIPITLSSDAHRPDDLVREFTSTAELLNDIGFKNLSILKDGIWKQMPFNQHGIIG
jgi:histidinol-phosphatase (PHP family)